MKQIHRDNLTKLASYLEKLPTEFTYRGQTCPAAEKGALQEGIPYRKNLHYCGSPSCFAGYGIPAGVAAPKSARVWEEYCEKAYGIYPYSTDLEFYWLFSPHWEEFDNTVKGAAARIRYFLDRGVPSEFRVGNINTGTPLLYKRYVLRAGSIKYVLQTVTPTGWRTIGKVGGKRVVYDSIEQAYTELQEFLKDARRNKMAGDFLEEDYRVAPQGYCEEIEHLKYVPVPKEQELPVTILGPNKAYNTIEACEGDIRLFIDLSEQLRPRLEIGRSDFVICTDEEYTNPQNFY